MKARQVLEDCRTAMELAGADMSPDHHRVHWVALLALLRAVGHVLHKVDGDSSSALKDAIARRHAGWKADRSGNRIFWEFIEEERNLVLKTYEIRYHKDDVVIEGMEDGRIVRHENVPLISELEAGPFEGRPALEVAQSAWLWWARELDAIEKDAKEHGA